MSLLTIILVLLLIGVLFGGYRMGPGVGYYGGGLLGVVLVIILILVLMGRIHI